MSTNSESDDEVPRGWNANSEDCVKSSGSLLEQRVYFDSAGMLNAVLAGDISGSLKLAGDTLGVRFVCRDNWILIQSAGPEKLAAAEKFLSGLREFYTASGAVLLPQDVRQIVNSAAAGSSGLLRDYTAQKIPVSSKKRDIMPRTPAQLAYVKAMRTSPVVFGIGPAGTGKTFLAMAMAVSKLLSGEYDRIILTRPAVEAGENLGFLPGNLTEKINPYLRPLYDALYEMMNVADAAALIERNVIEVAPLAFMRGRTLNHAFVILDEAQNTTPEQMLMFLTRLGAHAQCVVCGDPTQTDLPQRKSSGLFDAVRRLENVAGISVCHFKPVDVVRRKLVEDIVNAYTDNGGKGEEQC